MYSLVSSAVLVTDLLKQDEAGTLLGVVETALQLTGADLPALAAAGSGRDPAAVADARSRAASIAAARPTTAQALAALRRGGVDEAGRMVADAGALAGVPLASLADLQRLLGSDVLAWAATAGVTGQAATQVVCDAVSAAWTRMDLPDDDAALLAGPWRTFTADRSPRVAATDFGPGGAAIRALLTRLTRTDGARLDTLEAAESVGRRAGQWAADMHAATWAAHLSERLRPVAAAQLAAGRALLLSGLDGRVLALRAGRSVTAAIQGLCVADLLGDEVLGRLMSPAAVAYGPPR